MKKLLITTFVSVAFLAGCTDVKDVVISKKEDIEAHSGDLKKLPDEDKKLVLGYFLRAEGNGLFGEGLNLKFTFTNNSNKGIDAISSAIRLAVDGVGEPVVLNMGDEVFKKTLNPGDTAEMVFTAAANDLRMAKIKQGSAKVNASFEKLEVLYSDGKDEKVLE